MATQLPDDLTNALASLGAAFDSCEQAAVQSTPAVMASSGAFKALAAETVAAVAALGTISSAFAKTVADMLATVKQQPPPQPAPGSQPPPQPPAPGPKPPQPKGASKGGALAGHLTEAMAQAGQAFKGVYVAATGSLSATLGLRQAFQSAGKAAVELGSAVKIVGQGFARTGAVMAAAFAGVVVAANQLAKLPMAVLEKAISSVGSEIGRFVQLAQPGVFQLFERSIKDLYASIGIALIPVLEKATQVFRAIGGAIYGLTGNGQKAIQVLAAVGVSFVSLGVVLGGIAAAAVIGAVALKGFAAAMALVEAIASGGALVPVLIAVGAGMEFIGTAGAALAGVLTALSGVAIAVTGVMTDLTPVLNLFASTISSFMDSLGTAFKQFAGSDLLLRLAKMFDGAARAVGGFIVQLAPAFASLVNIFVKLLPVASTIVSILGQITAAPFIALAKVFEVVGPMLEAFAEAFADTFAEVGSLVFDIAKAFAELAVELVVMNPVFQLLAGTAKQLGIMFAGLALAMKDMIVNVVGWIRDILGLPAMQAAEPGKPKDNTGAAVTSAKIGDPKDALTAARLSAFQMGTGSAKPEERTAKNTDEINKAIQGTRDSIKAFFNEFPGKVREFIIEAGGVVAEKIGEKLSSATNPTANMPGGKPTGTPLDRLPPVSLGGVIAEQLKRLNPF